MQVVFEDENLKPVSFSHFSKRLMVSCIWRAAVAGLEDLQYMARSSTKRDD
jgi:hypothetical protein